VVAKQQLAELKAKKSRSSRSTANKQNNVTENIVISMQSRSGENPERHLQWCKMHTTMARPFPIEISIIINAIIRQ